MNEIRLTGKVLSCYIDKRGFFSAIIANVHEHSVNGQTDTIESVFRAVLPHVEKSKHIDIIKGDKVLVTGYLKTDRSVSAGGNEHRRNNIYIKEIDIVKPKKETSVEFADRFFSESLA